jgi:PadR family transcriptional regulator, regulatory protein PadR
MIILKTILYGPAHGQQIGKHIWRTTNEFLQVQHGSLYPRFIACRKEGGAPNGRLRRTEIGNSNITD